LASKGFTVTFLGVGGSCSVSSHRRARYGSNTSCVMVEAGEHLIILDMGTGLVRLPDFIGSKEIKRADILLSHFHCDHIEGFPFFKPFFTGERFDIYASASETVDTVGALSGYMKRPYLPIGLVDFRAEMLCHNISEPSFVLSSGVQVHTFALNHPGSATAYRLEYGGRSLVYGCDHEPRPDESGFIEFCRETDLLIYDAFFTGEEFASGVYKGWGHSHHEAGLEVAKAAKAKRLAFTHHHINRSDDDLDAFAVSMRELSAEAQPEIIVAAEGLQICLD
jgi:phosphoribosyl 1,2-cyclic phosphodiesterase